MIGDFLRAVGQIGDRRFLGVFVKALLLTAALLAGFLFAWGWLVSLIPEAGLSLFGWQLTAVDWLAGALAWAAGAVAAVVLMMPVAAVFIGLYLEDVADAVEARRWPDLPPAGRLTLAETLADGLVFAGALIVANLLAFAVYPFAGPLAPAVFLGMNGWLLGRQYFELAAGRRLGASGARALRRRATADVWGGGVLMALALSIPVLNLAAPVLGVAAYTHAVHRTARREGVRLA